MNLNRRLSSLEPGESAVIDKLLTKGSMRRRLMDMGFVDGTRIECVLQAAGKDPKAFLVRGAVIALRSEDSSTVCIED